MAETYDVVVVGSGAAGMTAALRARDNGLSVIVVEKASKYGGTSATSGGVIWIPNHGLPGSDDSHQQAIEYLDAITSGPVQRERLLAYVDSGPEMLRYLDSIGIEFASTQWPDYFPLAAGARADRSVVFPMFDGLELGNDFTLMREQYTRFKLLNRYSMDFTEAFTISARATGWRRTLARVLGRYWLDWRTRRLTSRDRWLTLGAALIGRLRQRLTERNVEIRLDTALRTLHVAEGRVAGIEVSHFGRCYQIAAQLGVIVCAGGFEWNQALRDRYFTLPGLTRWSSSPENANRGEALEAGLAVGANTEFTESGWWVPTMTMPIRGTSNFEETHQAVFDVGRPHSVCVNRNGERFVDESCGYDRFGSAMAADQLKTGANLPCWLVFDANFRRKFTAGGFMPTAIMPDRKIPIDWWDHYIFAAPTIEALAAKIGIDPAALDRTVANMNEYARTGKDPEFQRGGNAYDRSFGDASVSPNPCLGSIGRPPFYAVPINLGDLGTKGGLKSDACARVLDHGNQPIPGLYAAGNATGSPFGDCYPGAGGTIGPAMVFGFVAANEIARERPGLSSRTAAVIGSAAPAIAAVAHD